LSRTGTTSLPDRWNDASGGLAYHWRAWRYRKRLWRSFHAQVARWLTQWQPAGTTLILIGPSAGYALPTDFLARFDTLVAIEPDPLARWRLRRRRPDACWQFVAEDVFTDPQALERLAQRFPTATFLFCNVIGQVMGADELMAWREAHARWFASHDWASWHDVFSSDRPPHGLPTHDETLCGPAAAAEVARRLWSGLPCAVEDHGSFGLWPGAEHALWPITPTQWHVIGWVHGAGQAARHAGSPQSV